jgi:hypothetical protein
MVDYNKRRPRHCITLWTSHRCTTCTHSILQKCKNTWETFCGVHEIETIRNKLVLWKRFFTVKMREGEDLLVHINMVKALADQLHSIKVKIEDEDVYMVLFMNLFSSWSWVWSPLRMLTFNSFLFNYFMRFPREKKMKTQKMLHFLTNFIKQMKSFVFIIKKPDILWRIVKRRRMMRRKR